MNKLFFSELEKSIEQIREKEETLSQQEKEKEIEKVIETIDRLVKIDEIAREDGLLELERYAHCEGEEWEPELLRGISLVVDGVYIEELQQLFWNKYYARKPKGYEALRFLINMNGMYYLQSHKSSILVRDCLCSMLPDDMETIYRSRHKEEPREVMPVQAVDEEETKGQILKEMPEFVEKQHAETESIEETFHEFFSEETPFVEEDDYFDEEECVESESKKFLQAYTPAKIEELLNEYIVGQPELVKAVSDFLYYHMLRKEHPELPMRNLLVAGSSGTGKTEVFRCIQKLFANIQIKIADGSRVTKEGWTGSYKLKDIINSDLDILIIDEADKMCKPSFTSGGNNVAEDMQSEFLKLLEGEYDTTGRKKPWDKEKCMVSIVFVGAFESIRERKRKTAEVRSIGFGMDYESEEKSHHEITDEDLIEFGMMPELVGRIASKVTTNDLSNEDYISILKNPHSRLSSLIDVLQQYDICVDDIINKENIIALIDKSKANRTGFRWVSAQVENMLLASFHEQGLKQVG